MESFWEGKYLLYSILLLPFGQLFCLKFRYLSLFTLNPESEYFACFDGVIGDYEK